MSIKSFIKNIIGKNQALDYFVMGAYKPSKTLATALSCYTYDLYKEVWFTGWRGKSNRYWKLSSELIFYYHKIEKGLSLPNKKEIFGIDVALKIIDLLQEWKKENFDQSHTIYLAAIESLRSYKQANNFTGQHKQLDQLTESLDKLLYSNETTHTLSSPIKNRKQDSDLYQPLKDLAETRRSVRNFKDETVDLSDIVKAIEIAQLSPSACNRQPWKVHIYDDKEDILKLLSFQGGNSGFRETIPILAIITADQNSFFDATERIESMLDSGLFLMTFIYALHSLHLSTCCLNWCVSPSTDLKIRKISGIPINEKIATFLAIGKAQDDILVPLSARRPIEDVYIKH